MWGQSGTSPAGRALVATATGAGTATGSRQSRAGASPGSTGEEGGSSLGGGRRKEGEGSESDCTGDDSAPASPPKNDPIVVKACLDEGDRKGDSSCDRMEGGGYYQPHPAHPGNHLGHGGGGVHQPLVRGPGGYPGPGGPLEEGEVRRGRGGTAAASTTRDGVVIIERRPSQEGIQPAEMQVLMSLDHHLTIIVIIIVIIVIIVVVISTPIIVIIIMNTGGNSAGRDAGTNNIT